MITRLWILLSLLIVSGTSNAVVGDCTRHFYNNTKEEWTITFKSGVDEVAYTLTKLEHHPVDYKGIFLPKVPSAIMTITGPNYKGKFVVEGTVDCVYIKHDGDTGPVSLNSPADGDVTIN